MKFIISCCALAAFAVLTVSAFPQHEATILKAESDVSPDGHYHYSFESDDGVKVEQHGESKAIGSEFGNSAAGQFSYKSPEGQSVEVQYVADENGYRATGDGIPETPEAILRAIKYNDEHPQAEGKGF